MDLEPKPELKLSKEARLVGDDDLILPLIESREALSQPTDVLKRLHIGESHPVKVIAEIKFGEDETNPNGKIWAAAFETLKSGVSTRLDDDPYVVLINGFAAEAYDQDSSLFSTSEEFLDRNAIVLDRNSESAVIGRIDVAPLIHDIGMGQFTNPEIEDAHERISRKQVTIEAKDFNERRSGIVLNVSDENSTNGTWVEYGRRPDDQFGFW